MNATLITKNCKGKEAVIKVNGVPGQEASHLLLGGGGAQKGSQAPTVLTAVLWHPNLD